MLQGLGQPDGTGADGGAWAAVGGGKEPEKVRASSVDPSTETRSAPSAAVRNMDVARNAALGSTRHHA